MKELIEKIFKGDKVIWTIFFCLSVISIVEVFSASSFLTYDIQDHWSPIIKHTLFITIGAGIMILLQKVHFKWFRLIGIILPFIAGFFLVFTTIKGIINPALRTNGAARWIEILGVRFQPSELAKVALICAIAFILSKLQGKNHAKQKAFNWIIGVTFALAIPITIENFSTGAILFAVMFLMLFVGRVKIVTLAKAGLLVLVLALAVYGVSQIPGAQQKLPVLHRVDTWMSRLGSFNSDEAEDLTPVQYMEKYNQRGHANIAIATSGLLGVGPGNSVQRDYLSQAFSDFIYAIIIEELGLIPAGFIALLYIILLFRIGKVAIKYRDKIIRIDSMTLDDKVRYNINDTQLQEIKNQIFFGIFLIMGIGFLFVIQALINMMVAVDIIPITGQPLPFVSKGGTSTFINCALLGMVLSVTEKADVNFLKLAEETEHKQENSDNTDTPPTSLGEVEQTETALDNIAI